MWTRALVATRSEDLMSDMIAIDIFPWDDNFATGLSAVDVQHRRLVALLNKLATEVAVGEHVKLEPIFNELFDYASYHFATEEKIWNSFLVGEPEQEAHEAEHARFVSELSAIVRRWTTEPETHTIEDVLAFLVRWLAAHILESDRRLAEIVKGVQRGLPIAQARAAAKEALSGAHQTMIDIILSIYATLSRNTLQLMRELATHRRIDAELRRSEASFRDFFDRVRQAVSVRDEQGRFLTVNATAARMHGHPREWFIGKTPHEIGLCGLDKNVLRTLHQAALNGEPQTFRTEGIRGDGSRFPKEVHMARTSWFGQTAVIAMATDITERTRAEEALREERQRLSDILWAMNAGTWEWNVQTGECRFNARWAEIIGYTLDELAPVNVETWLRYAHPDDLERSNAALKAHFSGDAESYECEARMHHKDGHWVWVLDRGRVISRTADGEPLWMSGTHIDITDRKRAEQRLRQSASVFEHASEGITITDVDGTILDVNAAFTRITGYQRHEVIGQNPRILKSGRHGPAFYEEMWSSLLSTGHWQGELWNRRKDGELCAELLTINAIRDEEGQTSRYVALFSDITTAKEHQSRLEFIAHYDPLTGLPNRALLSDRLAQGLESAKRRESMVGVAYLDLDGFKDINDRYGHDVGDQFLTTLAKRMEATMRAADTLARFGGDEFVAVFLDLRGRHSMTPGLNRLMDVIAEPVEIEGRSLRVSVSIGVSLYPQPEPIEADQLIRQADQAMYQAKQDGKSRYHFFDVAADQDVRDHRETQERIRKALRHDEFVLFYQPKVNLRTGAVIGAEALIRWQHPERGLLPPGAFLPAIDEHPLSISLGRWVLKTALDQVVAWRREGLVLPVSVNVDGIELQQADYIEHLSAELAARPTLEPGDLELELLETSALEDQGRVTAVMHACAKLGVHFALDDFGTGYSTLANLKSLPAEQLKIDRSFVRDMLEDPDDMAILDGVIGLAEAFQRRVIAEGLEELEHGELLLALGCELAQGYGIARPMPPAEIPSWVATWQAPVTWRQVRRIHRADVPALFALTAHRRRVAQLETAVATATAWPVFDVKCRLGNWLARAEHEEPARADALAHAHGAYHEAVRALVAQPPTSPATQTLIKAVRATSEALQRALREAVMGPLTHEPDP